MSRAIASARQRRAGIVQEQPPVQQPPQMQPQGLTLPQVISVVDARLIKLEKFMNESQQESSNGHSSTTPPVINHSITQPLIEEFQNRFDLLAQEIMNLKDIVLKLQSYTMDVNKQLLEERTLSTATNGLFNMELQNFDDDDAIDAIDTIEEIVDNSEKKEDN
jgi:hypothetical protein